ncbi:hypothetical protein B0H14DRAFT_3525010 [Mycena olivaceomarginata]|nr:hypothetical protein B0H14DRAFT_3525010 [Mycena olivaceomarginata]
MSTLVGLMGGPATFITREAAARLAALTPLPPSPTLSQEARDEALAPNPDPPSSHPIFKILMPVPPWSGVKNLSIP